jgi:hypothetical protein
MCTALNSDHLPISITFLDDRLPPRMAHSYVNFKRAKWGLFTQETEQLFARERPPLSASAGEKHVRRILARASKHHIAAGFRKDFMPGLSREAVELTKDRDQLREVNPQDPEIPRLNHIISETISKDSKKAWIEQVEASKLVTIQTSTGDCFAFCQVSDPNKLPTNPPFFETDVFRGLRQLQSVSASNLLLFQITNPSHAPDALTETSKSHILLINPLDLSWLHSLRMPLINPLIAQPWDPMVSHQCISNS